ncbi:MAG TPA: hypothetical protein VK465_00175 [Fibrobacteria bacterium]|nr:hypothetical protein [Fibrobacteria bacterium]
MQGQAMEITIMKQKQGFTGNRYTPEQKKKVTRFVQEYDSKHGRGGIAAAQRQFKVSYIALRNWLLGNHPLKNKTKGFVPVLDRLTSIKHQMRDLEKEIRRLRRRV